VWVRKAARHKGKTKGASWDGTNGENWLEGTMCNGKGWKETGEMAHHKKKMHRAVGAMRFWGGGSGWGGGAPNRSTKTREEMSRASKIKGENGAA